MIVKSRFSLDTSILVYAVDRDVDELHERSKQLIGHATWSDCVLTVQAVGEHQLSFWDAMIWSAARQGGCSAILSEDMQDGRRLNGVELSSSTRSPRAPQPV